MHASFFGITLPSNPLVVVIPKDRLSYALPSSQILETLSEHNVSMIDQSGGVVTFKKECYLMGKEPIIQQAFIDKVLALSPYTLIERKPSIEVKSKLPSDFERYVLESITLNESMLRKNSGSFIGHFSVAGKPKKITFYYEMVAKLPIFKAKRNLQSGTIVTLNDVEKVWLELDAISSKAIVELMPRNVIAKTHIKEGQILSDYHLDAKKDILKKETIKASLTEGALVIELHVTLLEDANIGDTVKVKTDQGKVLSAQILSLNEAKIVQ